MSEQKISEKGELDGRLANLRVEAKAYMDDRVKQFEQELQGATDDCMDANDSLLLCELDTVVKAAKALGRAIADRDAMCFHMRIAHPRFVLDEEEVVANV